MSAFSRVAEFALASTNGSYITTIKAKGAFTLAMADKSAPRHVRSPGFGAWAVGDTWGKVDDGESMAALHCALDRGANFFDTADVYGDGRSERLLARLRHERTEKFYLATKAGRGLEPHVADGYHRENLTAFVARSLKNFAVEAIDLLQLHCPPGASLLHARSVRRAR